MKVLLVSAYELGHQPWHLAAPSAALAAGGHEVRTVDLSVEMLPSGDVDWAEAIGFSVPMHTATRMAVGVARQVKARRPELPVCFYGLYAASGKGVADVLIAGEYLPPLLEWLSGRAPTGVVALGPAPERVPVRISLPSLDRYARLADGNGERVAGYVEATHGCSHRCRHCPVPVVYDGRVRRIPEAAVLGDVAGQVAAGATHITFGDPDFLNVPGHAMRVVRAFAARFRGVTFDVTTKVEHILRHPEIWDEMAAAGCRFVVSAFETTNDAVLSILDKGHTATEMAEAVGVVRSAGIEVRPSFMPFTPWTAVGDLAEIFDFLEAHDLLANVEPVQLSIRLLLPPGSLLLSVPEISSYLDSYDQEALSWRWHAADAAVEALQREVAAIAEAAAAGEDPVWDTLARMREAADRAAGRDALARRPIDPGPFGRRPRLTEPWFCCAEPTGAQLDLTIT